jgi:calcineurin-like phosphoesterase family protein
MNETIAKNWNSVVSPEDTVIHLGDLSCGLQGRKDSLSELCRSLNGNIILIKGNHDHFDSSFYINECGFKAFVKYIKTERVFFSHIPVVDEYKAFDEKEAFQQYKKEWEEWKIGKQNPINIFGHVHNTHFKSTQGICVSVENTNYTPLDLSTILN